MSTTIENRHLLPPAPKADPEGMPSPHPRERARPTVRGKFLFVGDEKLYVRGVTYGTFRPTEQGEDYDRDTVSTDFRMMAEMGINVVRVYTVPPTWLLDVALAHGLYVLVGLPWEQHIAFLDKRAFPRSIRHRVRDGVRACAGHPAMLGFAIGNEIPGSIVRWYGRQRVERFLASLAKVVRQEDPGALVTYVNFPTTEYLCLDFLDFLSFNVYLESPDTLDPYLARLQNLAGDKPLLIAEIGLDSRRNGYEAQAAALDWQLRSAFQAGCTGAIVYAWTDEWYRGGHDIDDWDFGLVTRQREPKPALSAVRQRFAESPFTDDRWWPRVSVIVCSYNGSRTIGDCLEGMGLLDYPDFEVIVVDDGSTDGFAEIASGFDVRLIQTPNQGLGAARNEGMRAATGEILAYIDDDARPDPQWLRYVADMYQQTGVVAVGGPNIAPAGDGDIAEAVYHAPGGPVHVLVTDTEADHLPGCNLTIRKDALDAIGGFDTRYRAAGDDVDVCWRLQDAGGVLAFSPGAMVWHHRRNSARTYWKQQQGYGKAEALLEEKWPERYNAMGHHSWRGRIYGNGLTRAVLQGRGRVYQGVWGSAPFQMLYQPTPGLVASLPLMPEWWLVVGALGGLGLLGMVWTPLLWVWMFFALALLAPIVQAALSGMEARLAPTSRPRLERWKVRALIAWFHLIQPIARLRGRIRFGLTPWRLSRARAFVVPTPREISSWRESWIAPEGWLEAIMEGLTAEGAKVRVGGNTDTWDLDVRGGLLGGCRLLMAIEEHGGGKQMALFRIVPRMTATGIVLGGVPLVLAVLAALDHAWLAAGILAGVALLVLARWIVEAGQAVGISLTSLQETP